MYARTVTCVQTHGGLNKYFPISIGLHQGSTLNSYPFALALDLLTRHLQVDLPWCMLFAYVILLVDKTREGVEGKKSTHFRYLGPIVQSDSEIDEYICYACSHRTGLVGHPL
ncbi:hypothetical protein KFK09_028858 [Dendrobium nobile]|uniref:Reverse transcriptase n=1 Tax=Dendrobium nobile TaxID=94219 RepID=A0A8T3A477_DENNO|nr:hypothetical protein KFK09_028858 [Dendrobium nobile]